MTKLKLLTDKEMKAWIDEKWGFEKIPIGAVVPYPGSSTFFKTGDWSSLKANIDRSKCTKCTRCFFLCPDSAIIMDTEEYPVTNFDYCKGCGICAEECPSQAIEMKDMSKQV